MNVQLDLPVKEAAQAPDVSPEQVEAFVQYLTGRDWTYRRQIEADTGWDERLVRALSRAARPRVVSYPGSPGYKLWNRCTVEELDKCIRAYRAVRDDAYESYLIFWKEYHAPGTAARS